MHTLIRLKAKNKKSADDFYDGFAKKCILCISLLTFSFLPKK